jgi:hypothetical protein
MKRKNLENVALNRWREVPHELMVERARSAVSLATLEEWGIPLLHTYSNGKDDCEDDD